jgi:hypothetical protein
MPTSQPPSFPAAQQAIKQSRNSFAQLGRVRRGRERGGVEPRARAVSPSVVPRATLPMSDRATDRKRRACENERNLHERNELEVRGQRVCNFHRVYSLAREAFRRSQVECIAINTCKSPNNACKAPQLNSWGKTFLEDKSLFFFFPFSFFSRTQPPTPLSLLCWKF